jgi:hypothetical protein
LGGASAPSPASGEEIACLCDYSLEICGERQKINMGPPHSTSAAGWSAGPFISITSRGTEMAAMVGEESTQKQTFH